MVVSRIYRLGWRPIPHIPEKGKDMKVLVRALLALLLTTALAVGAGGSALVAQASPNPEPTFTWKDWNGDQQQCWTADDCAHQILDGIWTTTDDGKCYPAEEKFCETMKSLEQKLWAKVIKTWDDAQAALSEYRWAAQHEAEMGSLYGINYHFLKDLLKVREEGVESMFDPVTHE